VTWYSVYNRTTIKRKERQSPYRSEVVSILYSIALVDRACGGGTRGGLTRTSVLLVGGDVSPNRLRDAWGD